MGDSLLQAVTADDVAVVSFDVFDTALRRKVAAAREVFAVMHSAEPGLVGCNWVSVRTTAEAQARRLSRSEVTLDDIYAQVAKLLSIDATTAGRIKELELTWEQRLSAAWPAVLEASRAAAAAGKQVWFTSDMYLPRAVIARMLEQAGYDVEDRLLVSCAEGCTKRGGGLYRVLIERSGAPAQRTMHVGDHRRVDGWMARRAGLRAYHFQPPAAPKGRTVTAGDALARGCLRAADEQRFWHRLGYQVAGPVFLGFGQWLAMQVGRREAEAVYLLARDGKVMLPVWDRLRKLDPSLPPATYTLASRRALMAIAGRLGDPVDYALRVSSRLQSVDQWADWFGVAAEQVQGWPGPDADPAALRLWLESLRPTIDAALRQQREAMLAYYRQIGLLASGSGSRVVVDVGWKGNCFRALHDLVRQAHPGGGGKVKLAGLFLGLRQDTRSITAELDTAAWQFHYGRPYRAMRVICASMAVLELLFSADEGSLVRMEMVDGQPTPVLHESGVELEGRREAIDGLQAGALRFVDDWLDAGGGQCRAGLTSDFVLDQLARLLEHPTREEATRIGALPVLDRVGLTPTIATPPPFGWVLRHPAGFLRDYALTCWRGAYRRQIPGWWRWVVPPAWCADRVQFAWQALAGWWNPGTPARPRL